MGRMDRSEGGGHTLEKKDKGTVKGNGEGSGGDDEDKMQGRGEVFEKG